MFRTVGQVLLGGMFVVGGYGAFMEPDMRAKKVEQAGIPEPRRATILNGAVMAVAGSFLSVGLFPRLASLALIGTLIPTTFVGHPYWEETDPAMRANHRIHFLKNLSMLGGLFLVLRHGNK